MIPYAKHNLQAEDIMEVLRTLQGPAITQGTAIDWLEAEFSKAVGSHFAVAINSGTAALHSALVAADINEGDEVITPSMTFVATANVIKYMRAIPIFADINPKTLLIDTEDVKRKISEKTKAIIAVDYAGQPADYDELQSLCKKYNLILVADACHSLGAEYKYKKVGTLADLNCFSLHATKLITSGEGGIVTTDIKRFAEKMKAFRNHGRVNGDMQFLGYNYRMTHLQAALCIHQIKRIPYLVAARQRLSEIYETQLEKLEIETIKQREDRTNARHIFVIKTKFRDIFRNKLSQYNVQTQVHYKPVTLQSFYGCPGVTPIAEEVWEEILTIPLYPHMTDSEQETVIRGLQSAVSKTRKS